ncbi:MAG: GTPase HflX, partial [Oscillospiraceae bacterium]|nr:GTPase HflX [Oscillospiraceae bacterium]
GGGIGTRGPGESKLETDKRHIRRRIEALEAELKELERRRELHRARRKKDNVLSAAIVGYTNVGKSTLLNALTDAGVLAENKLFATLDITSRAIELPDGRSVLLIDTVGLIRRLPHNLVEAFKSTLEEAAAADIIINLIDISAEDGYEQAQVTAELLEELGCGAIPRIDVLNKCDLLPEAENIKCDERTVKISAKQKKGFDELLECIARNLPETSVRGKFVIPYDKTGILNTIRIDGKILSEEYLPEGTLIDAIVDKKVLHVAESYRTN